MLACYKTVSQWNFDYVFLKKKDFVKKTRILKLSSIKQEIIFKKQDFLLGREKS
jgi:hypothetical protein